MLTPEEKAERKRQAAEKAKEKAKERARKLRVVHEAGKTEHLEAVKKLSKDIMDVMGTLDPRGARILVDAYYAIQDQRIINHNQTFSAMEGPHATEPHAAVAYLCNQFETLEKELRKALQNYAQKQLLGRWAMSITGIGPVISAGLLAHLDPQQITTAGKLWRFAGLDPTQNWLGKEGSEKCLKDLLKKDPDLESAIFRAAKIIGCQVHTLRRLATTDNKGQPKKLTKDTLQKAMAKRPWNARLKVLCWKIGESFVKVAGNKNDIYGRYYKERKVLETDNNAEHMYADQAKAELERRRYGSNETREAYEQGLLPDGRIHARAKRYAVKMFLAHYQQVAHFITFNRLGPRPWIIEHGGHADEIAPPNMEMIPGMKEAWIREGRGGLTDTAAGM